jgi:hypothetical protein
MVVSDASPRHPILQALSKIRAFVRLLRRRRPEVKTI